MGSIVFGDVARQAVGETGDAVVVIEIISRMHHRGEIGRHVDVLAAVVVVVARHHRCRVIVTRDAKGRRDIRELPTSVVPKKIVRAVVSKVQIEVSVVVVVEKGGADAAIDGGPAEAIHEKIACDVGEPTRIVAEEAVGVAILVGNKQVEIAVSVHVEPHRAHGLSRIGESDCRSHVGEGRARTVIAIEGVGTVAERDIKIHIAIAVVVDEHRLTRGAEIVDAHRGPDLHEVPALVMCGVDNVAVELVPRPRAAGEAHEKIEVPVRVVIAPGRRANFVAFV